MKTNQDVQKMMSPEEMQLLGTVQSAISEILALNNAGGGTGEDIIASLNKSKENDETIGDTTADEDKDKKNKTAKKENNGPTASENADQRLDPETEINDKNMAEVGKALLSLITKKQQPVQKSQPEITANVIAQAIAQQLKPIVKEMNEMKTFQSNVLDSLGLTDDILKKLPGTQEVNKSSDNFPVQSVDSTAIVQELLNVIKSQNEQINNKQVQSFDNFNNDWNGLQEARKNLAEAMPFIFQNAAKKQQV